MLIVTETSKEGYRNICEAGAGGPEILPLVQWRERWRLNFSRGKFSSGGEAGAGCLAGLGLQPLHHASGACSRSWGPLPGVVYLTMHTLGPQGVTQPCSPHSSSAMQPVGPPQPGDRACTWGWSGATRDTPLPSWPQPFAAAYSLSFCL